MDIEVTTRLFNFGYLGNGEILTSINYFVLLAKYYICIQNIKFNQHRGKGPNVIIIFMDKSISYVY